MSQPKVTATLSPPCGSTRLHVHYFPDKKDDPSPVWIGLYSSGCHSYACLTVDQAQELCSGIQSVIKAKTLPHHHRS